MYLEYYSKKYFQKLFSTCLIEETMFEWFLFGAAVWFIGNKLSQNRYVAEMKKKTELDTGGSIPPGMIRDDVGDDLAQFNEYSEQELLDQEVDLGDGRVYMQGGVPGEEGMMEEEDPEVVNAHDIMTMDQQYTPELYHPV